MCREQISAVVLGGGCKEVGGVGAINLLDHGPMPGSWLALGNLYASCLSQRCPPIQIYAHIPTHPSTHGLIFFVMQVNPFYSYCSAHQSFTAPRTSFQLAASLEHTHALRICFNGAAAKWTVGGAPEGSGSRCSCSTCHCIFQRLREATQPTY